MSLTEDEAAVLQAYQRYQNALTDLVDAKNKEDQARAKVLEKEAVVSDRYSKLQKMLGKVS